MCRRPRGYALSPRLGDQTGGVPRRYLEFRVGAGERSPGGLQGFLVQEGSGEGGCIHLRVIQLTALSLRAFDFYRGATCVVPFSAQTRDYKTVIALRIAAGTQCERFIDLTNSYFIRIEKKLYTYPPT